MQSSSSPSMSQLASPTTASRVAVIGASGYGGLQTLRLLLDHPVLSATFLGGERSAGQRWSAICPFLQLPDDPLVESADPDRIADVADFAVLSLPNGVAARLAPQLIERGVRVVDLSADFRYRSLDQWSKVYAQEAQALNRSDADLCQQAVYGLPEWHGPAIAEASLVAAPGCFPTASLLPLLPFLKQGLIETDGIIMIGEIGGDLEIKAARWIQEHGTKPVVGFIAGVTAPKGRTMGHAGAIVSGEEESAEAKKRVLRECGVHVVDSPADIGDKMAELLA